MNRPRALLPEALGNAAGIPLAQFMMTDQDWPVNLFGDQRLQMVGLVPDLFDMDSVQKGMHAPHLRSAFGLSRDAGGAAVR